MTTERILAILAVILVTLPAVPKVSAATLTFEIKERNRTTPLPCRIHLRDGDGKPVRPPGLPFWRDHFVCPGRVEVEVAPGTYSFEIERGPEYRMEKGQVAVGTEGAKQAVELERLVGMAGEGWWSGELHVHRPVTDVPLLMDAEDLHVATVITWWNNQNHWAGTPPPGDLLRCLPENRCHHVMGGEDEREGGALLYFHLSKPLPIQGASREFPSPMRFLELAREQSGVWVDVEKPFWWDVPVWVASGKVDSIGLANNHMCRDQMYEDEAWGRPRDAQRLPAPRGNGFWTQEIYYHLLNCGLRLPPSAGSASGVLPNPVGYNRVYVHLGKEFDYARWWDGLRAGRSFVSNGPLLRVRANGQWPGHVFRSVAPDPLEIALEAELTSRDPISMIEIVKDGRVERAVPFAEWKQTGKLGTLRFTESGWFLVRVLADNPKTFRFASTAPCYVERGPEKSRISRASAQFFVDWVRERKTRIRLDDSEQRREVLKYQNQAEQFWLERVEKANAE